MAQHNSLMEWLAQTKRISKEEDYMGLEIIDTVMDNIYLICPELIRRHRKFFNDLCNEYHKDPNPVSLLSDKKLAKALLEKTGAKSVHQWQSSFCRKPTGYPRGGCRAFKFFRKAITEQIDIQIERFKKAKKVITWQWFEVIDFMYERPELVNPSMLDEYIRNKINEVCLEGKKKNPLANGMMARFGKFWKDENGKWQTERRKRF